MWSWDEKRWKDKWKCDKMGCDKWSVSESEKWKEMKLFETRRLWGGVSTFEIQKPWNEWMKMKGDGEWEKMMQWIRGDGMLWNKIVWDSNATQGSKWCGAI